MPKKSNDEAVSASGIWLPNGSFWPITFVFACARMSAKHKNLVGPQVRKLRYQRGWKQKDLAAKLQILGWDIDRASVSKIESQLVWVGDFEMFYLAEALRVDLKQLFRLSILASRFTTIL